MEVVGSVLATLLPFALLAFALILWLWWSKRRGVVAAARAKPRSRAHTLIFLVLAFAFLVVASGSLGGWSLESVLMPIGWLVTGTVIVLLDPLLDRRIPGNAPKVVGPISYWWMLVCALPVGWASALASSEGSPWPTWVQVTVLFGLALGSVLAFCLRFGLRFWR